MANTFAEACASDVSWSDALKSYEWRGADFEAGLEARKRMHRNLAQALSQGVPATAIDEITAWGGVPVLRGDALDQTIKSLEILDAVAASPTLDASGLYAERIATVSKVYAMHDPERWAIYDSRVAWSLEELRGRLEMSSKIPPFAQPPARTASPHPNAPLVRTGRQARDGFLRASELIREIARRVPGPCPDPGGWGVQQIEMCLFALGGVQNREREPMANPRKIPNPTKLTPGGAAKDAVKKVAGSDVVRGTLEDHAKVFIDQQFAKVRAMRFARETDSVAAQAQFADGYQRWIVFQNSTPIASFPSYDGDLEGALKFHNYERLRMREPKELEREIEADRERRRKRWKIWARDGDEEEKLVVEELLELEAGPLSDD